MVFCSIVSAVLLMLKGYPCVSTRCTCGVLILALSQSLIDLIVARDDTLMN